MDANQRRAESLREYYRAHPEVIEEIRERNRQTQAGRERPELAKVLTGRHLSEDHKRRISESTQGRLLGNREAQAESLRRYYAEHPEAVRSISEKLKGHVVTDESKRRNSETNKANWQCGEFVQRLLLVRQVSPNQLEEWVAGILGYYWPGGWVFNGSGPLVIRGHVPDFRSTLDTTWLIEIFGMYWHDPLCFPGRLGESELVAPYAEVGYNCLVLWEQDLPDEATMVERVCQHFQLRRC